jgi:AcrR family transcriptional regulator
MAASTLALASGIASGIAPRPAAQAATGPGVGRGHMVDIQRTRMVDAMVMACAEVGAANASVAHVVARAGVSRRTFYELFADREDCFLATFDDVVQRALRRVSSVHDARARWVDRVRAALVALLRFLDEEPALARFLIVESLAGGPAALERRAQVLAAAARAVDAVREEVKGARRAPPLAAEGAVGGVLAVLHAHIACGEDERPLLRLANELTSMIVLPYLGLAAARHELGRPVPSAEDRKAHRQDGSSWAAEMRLTYRTLRVLAAVAAMPGCSNRQAAGAAGISDQGQASKLLRRLHRIGLVANVGSDPRRGEPNAWTLTDKGWLLREHFSSL